MAILAGVTISCLYLLGRKLFVAVNNRCANPLARAPAKATSLYQRVAFKAAPFVGRLRSRLGLQRPRPYPRVLPDRCSNTRQWLREHGLRCQYDPVFKGHYHTSVTEYEDIKYYLESKAHRDAVALGLAERKFNIFCFRYRKSSRLLHPFISTVC
jgi:hypothetical protein